MFLGELKLIVPVFRPLRKKCRLSRTTDNANSWIKKILDMSVKLGDLYTFIISERRTTELHSRTKS